MMDFKNIDISTWTQVGEGGVGKTYTHPDNPDILLKVRITGSVLLRITGSVLLITYQDK